MTRLINALSPADAQRIRDRIAGKPLPPAVAKPKSVGRIKCYVSQFYKYDPALNAHVIQLPIAFDRAMYNAGRTPFYLRERYVKQMRETVWLACASYLSSFDVRQLARVEFVRIASNKLDSDNISAAFKAIRDALCSYLEWGNEAREHIRAIGYADDRLEQRGVTWSYRQQKCEANPRLYGVRLVLYCKPPSES